MDCLTAVLEKIFIEKIMRPLRKVDLDNLQEIRIRVDEAVKIKVLDKQYELKSENGLVFVDKNELSEIIYRACDKSVYAYARQMTEGFIDAGGGVRIGVCGKVSREGHAVCGLKSYTSLCLRVPHAVKNCSLEYKKYLLQPPQNVLVISPPACGKTTFLRDMAYQLKNTDLNLLVIDERGEIAAVNNGVVGFAEMKNCDVIADCDKGQAFKWGLRATAPDIVVCDELFREDMRDIAMMINSGVKVFSSVHAKNVEDAIDKLDIDNQKLYDRYVVLSNEKGAGTVDGIFNASKERLYPC